MSETGARQDPVTGFRFTITFDDLPNQPMLPGDRPVK